jgi:hypothetical protein
MTIKNLINSEILKLPLIRNEEDFPDSYYRRLAKIIICQGLAGIQPIVNKAEIKSKSDLYHSFTELLNAAKNMKNKVAL